MQWQPVRGEVDRLPCTSEVQDGEEAGISVCLLLVFLIMQDGHEMHIAIGSVSQYRYSH